MENLDQRIIELYERRRWKVRLWTTIVLVLLGATMLPRMIDGGLYKMPVEIDILLSLAILVIIFVSAFKYDKYNKGLKKNPQLNRALNSEMYAHNDRRAKTTAFRALMIMFFVVFLLSGFIESHIHIPLKATIFVLCLLGFVVYQVSWLVYNK